MSSFNEKERQTFRVSILNNSKRFPGDCSDSQLEILAEFRKIVNEMQLTDPPYTETYLLRFCRARKFDLKKVEKMFVDFIEWRKQNDVDHISVCLQNNEIGLYSL